MWPLLQKHSVSLQEHSVEAMAAARTFCHTHHILSESWLQQEISATPNWLLMEGLMVWACCKHILSRPWLQQQLSATPTGYLNGVLLLTHSVEAMSKNVHTLMTRGLLYICPISRRLRIFGVAGITVLYAHCTTIVLFAKRAEIVIMCNTNLSVEYVFAHEY